MLTQLLLDVTSSYKIAASLERTVVSLKVEKFSTNKYNSRICVPAEIPNRPKTTARLIVKI